MNDLRRRRLRAPLFTAACGLALAIPVAVTAGWAPAAAIAAIDGTAALAYYWLGGRDSDLGALIAARADERQTTVRLWVRAFAAVALMVVATIGAIASAALGRTSWPYAMIVALGAACFLAGLGFYSRHGHLTDSGVTRHGGSRLDERHAAVLLRALQLAGITMFLAAIAGGLALSGKSGADPLRFLATAFAVAVITGFGLFRPHQAGGR